MLGSYQKLDIRYMYGLLEISKYLGFVIPYNLKKKVPIRSSNRWYSYLIIVAIIAIYILSTIRIYHNVMPTMTSLQILTESSVYFCIIMLDISSILEAIIKRKTLTKYLVLFVQIDQSLSATIKVRNYQNTICLQIFACHFLYILLESLNIYSWIYKFGINYYKNYMFEVFIKYYIVIITMIICNFTLAIMRRFQYLNAKLKEAIRFNNLDVNETKILFDRLNVLVRTHNDLFSFQIFVILSICVLALLDLLSYVLDIRYTFVEIILDVTFFIDSVLLVVRPKTHFNIIIKQSIKSYLTFRFRYKA